MGIVPYNGRSQMVSGHRNSHIERANPLRNKYNIGARWGRRKTLKFKKKGGSRSLMQTIDTGPITV